MKLKKNLKKKFKKGEEGLNEGTETTKTIFNYLTMFLLGFAVFILLFKIYFVIENQYFLDYNFISKDLKLLISSIETMNGEVYINYSETLSNNLRYDIKIEPRYVIVGDLKNYIDKINKNEKKTK